MPRPKHFSPALLVLFWLACLLAVPIYAENRPLPPPANDNCIDAMPITVTGSGYDYGTFLSQVSDITSATGQSGEFFEFGTDYFHQKSVWFQFTISTSRRIVIHLETAPGSFLPDPKLSGVTLYGPSSCLPGSADRLGSIISSGELERFCTTAGTYRIQVTAANAVMASFMVRLLIECPFDPIYPEVSTYDCPDKAFVFNSGQPLPPSSSQYTQPHAIDCHSIEDPTEYACLPVANRSDFRKSSWYVFTTGDPVDLLAFDFRVFLSTDKVGYRLLEGNVRNQPLSSLPLVDCGMAYENATTRYIEFPCILKPNTTYSLSLLFDKDFAFDDLNLRALQRGMSPSGWPMPVQPPADATNELGVMPAVLTWNDRFDCSSFISNNNCPPANPASGVVTLNMPGFRKKLDLATWATFTLATDANVKFDYTFSHADGEYYTRIFKRTLNAGCPSPSPVTDLYYDFTGKKGLVKCLPQGDYAIQVLASSNDTFPASNFYQDAWSNGYLGTRFSLKFTITALPSVGLFRLNDIDSAELINNLNPLVPDVMYPGTPAVFVCQNTVMPAPLNCMNVDKAIYREVNIGDADGDGQPEEGLLCISTLRTDTFQGKPISYQLLKGDANQLAAAAGTHNAGEWIPGLVDYAGICINVDDFTINPHGIDNFCACVTEGTYTLAGYGDVDNVGIGDAPGFKLTVSKTIHDSPQNAEVINVGHFPGNYPSGIDVFSCTNNPGNVPPCGGEKLVYREFYLDTEMVVTITEIGQASSVMSLFAGRAVDITSASEPVLGCFVEAIFTDPCTPLAPGWYTLISYGSGPDYVNTIWNIVGYRGDVGKTTRVNILLQPPTKPMFNRPEKAYQAGVTDWTDPPANNPNAATAKFYYFATETFCLPDTPYIADTLMPCTPEYNRVAFYVFEITKPSFIQILGVNPTFFAEVFPFDVNARPDDLQTVPPVYPCLSAGNDTRQLCDLPPGKYTIAIFATDFHFGMTVTPVIRVEEADISRFDHAWEAYDFDFIPTTNAFVNGRPLDVHPTIPGQAPSRDVFYCTTGADVKDPTDTQCGTAINDLIYAQPAGIPKPLFLQNNPPPPQLQPYRNLWYTFKLSGSGVCTLRVEALNGLAYKPFFAVYESDADGDIPWSDLQTYLQNPSDTIIPRLRLIGKKVSADCDAVGGDIIFGKSGCLRYNVRYYVVVGFDAYEVDNFPPNLPNQAVAVSVKYDGKPTYGAPYDEVPTANVINGLAEPMPPYTSIPMAQGDIFSSVDFSLLCYTRNGTDPPGCDPPRSGKSAWFKFEIATRGQLLLALEKIGVVNGWVASDDDIMVLRDNGTGPPLTESFTLVPTFFGHEWLGACFDPGTYYVLVRHCSAQVDTLQGYRLVLSLVDSPGDFCSNAIPLDVLDFNPASASVIVNCHTIGTDVGEKLSEGNACFPVLKQKTSWFKVTLSAGPMVDLKFQLGENFASPLVHLSDVRYRILAGTCGAMTPIACSEGNINLTLNCLGQGDYYVQVAMPEKVIGGPAGADVDGTITLTVTATPSDTQFCTSPFNPFEIVADFSYMSDCRSVSFFNQSTAGTDIEYLWEFPDGTSTETNPVWMPTVGAGVYDVSLIVTNIVLQSSDTITYTVSLSDPFATYSPLGDQVLCNQETLTLDATYATATYQWDNNSTSPVRIIQSGGVYWVLMSLDGCQLADTIVVQQVLAESEIKETICSGESIQIHGEWFDENHPAGLITLTGADPSGCDSLISVQVSFLAPVLYPYSDTICDGDSYAFGQQMLTQANIYHDTLTAASGCDSIVILDLYVTPKDFFERDISDCVGNPVLLQPVINGLTYTWSTGSGLDTIWVNSAGAYSVSVTDAAGCIISEELFNVNFGMLESPVADVPPPPCAGDDIIVRASGSSGNYLWFASAVGGPAIGSGPSLLLPSLLTNTTIYVQAFWVGLDTCWSARVPVPAEVIADDAVELKMDTVICAGSSVMLPWGDVVQPASSDSFAYIWPSSVTGCDSLRWKVRIQVLDLGAVGMPAQLTLQLGDSVRLTPSFAFAVDSLMWRPPDWLSCADCPDPWAQPLQTIDYLLSVWSREGCLITAPVKIIVEHDIHVYVPNIFSPNGDGDNDLFNIIVDRGLGMAHRFAIYDRWGEFLWEAKDFLADGSVGWDGNFRGTTMMPGVYVWTCEVILPDGSTEKLKGDLVLLR